jgi:hypothetical protein
MINMINVGVIQKKIVLVESFLLLLNFGEPVNTVHQKESFLMDIVLMDTLGILTINIS